MTVGDPPLSWLSLPRRIYLDTSALQSLHDFGGQVFEGEPFVPAGRAGKVQGLADELDALRMIFTVNERAMFEFVVTEASLREVVARDRPRFTQWVNDVLDVWLIQSAGKEPPTPGTTFDDRRFGMISFKDRRLLQEALDWAVRCLHDDGAAPSIRSRVHRAGDGTTGTPADDVLGAARSLGKPVLLTRAVGRTEISRFDPLLTTVWTPYPTQPLLSFLHPPIERPAVRPRGGLDLDWWIHFPAVGVAVLTWIEIPHGSFDHTFHCRGKLVNSAWRAADHETIRRVSVESWAAIIGVFVALMALCFIGQPASAADRPADTAEKQADIQEQPIDAPQPQGSYR